MGGQALPSKLGGTGSGEAGDKAARLKGPLACCTLLGSHGITRLLRRVTGTGRGQGVIRGGGHPTQLVETSESEARRRKRRMQVKAAGH